MNKDSLIRSYAFSWLADQVALHGDVLPRRPLLEKGFKYKNERVPLVSMQGIFKPKIMSVPLSISTAPKGAFTKYEAWG